MVGAVMDDETVMKFAQANLNQSVKWGLYRLGLHDDKGFIKLCGPIFVPTGIFVF